MYTLSVIGLSICLVYISITMQGAESKTCIACTSDYAAAGGKCSAAETYVECAKDCTPSSASSGAEQVAEAARKATCGAGSIFVNLAVIGLGLTFYMLV